MALAEQLPEFHTTDYKHHTKEWKCREFAKMFPEALTKQVIKYAEEGRLTWGQVYNLICEATYLLPVYAVLDVAKEECEGVGE
jgi:hypothetical protein